MRQNGSRNNRERLTSSSAFSSGIIDGFSMVQFLFFFGLTLALRLTGLGRLDELCIAVFDDDKLWYRAVCLQAEPEKNAFTVQFIDFGNLASVQCESIRSLPKELAFPCAAHTCTVIDHSKVEKTLAQQQASQGYVVAQEITSDGELYSVKF